MIDVHWARYQLLKLYMVLIRKHEVTKRFELCENQNIFLLRLDGSLWELSWVLSMKSQTKHFCCTPSKLYIDNDVVTLQLSIPQVQLLHTTCSAYSETIPPAGRFKFRELMSRLETQGNSLRGTTNNNVSQTAKTLDELHNTVRDLVNLVQRWVEVWHVISPWGHKSYIQLLSPVDASATAKLWLAAEFSDLSDTIIRRKAKETKDSSKSQGRGKLRSGQTRFAITKLFARTPPLPSLHIDYNRRAVFCK